MAPVAPPSAIDVRAHLARILQSREFAQAKLRARLLQYLVEKTLAGEGATLKEYTIAIDVFDRPATFDPRVEPVVRVRMSQLRAKLNAYYDTAGRDDIIRIRLEAGSYVPRFEGVAARPAPPYPRGRRWRIIGAALAAICIVACLLALAKAKMPPSGNSDFPPQAAAVLVNGVCKFGNCTSPGRLLIGDSVVTNFDFTFTLPNTDKYRLSGRATSIDRNGLITYLPFTVTYVGNASATASSTDLLTIEVLQDFENLRPSEAFSTYTEGLNGSFGGPLAKTSSMAGQIILSGHALPLQGPFSPPESFHEFRKDLSLPALGNPVRKRLQRVVTFGAGSGAGAVIRHGIQ